MHAMVLCAGLGTRLRPLTDERPKPLVPLLGRPLASYALARLAAAGVRHVVCNTHHLGEQVGPALAPYAQKLNLALDTVHEPVLLGTGGALKNALPKLGNEPFFVCNGDVLAAPDLGALKALHAKLGARMSLVLRDDPRAEKLGAIDVDDSGRVRRILGEGPEPEGRYRRCVFTGVYLVNADLGDDLPENGCVVRHTMRRLLARGEVIAGLVDNGPWYDLGTIESYVSVHRGLLDGSIVYPGVKAPFEARHVESTARVEPGVKLGRYVSVGAGAVLRGNGALSDSIVWDGATVDAPASRVIVTQGGRVVPTGG